MKKRLLACLLILALLLSVNISAFADREDAVYWAMDDDGIVTISGYGEMPDFSYDVAPWDSVRNDVTAVVIEKGITHIGQESFEYCSNLKTVYISEGVESIGESAFYYCTSLETINIPSSVTELGEMVFDHCINLKTVAFPEGVESLESAVLNCCTALESVTIPASVTEIKYSAFNACKKLKNVYYTGSTTQWSRIEIESYNSCLTNASITCNASPSGGWGVMPTASPYSRDGETALEWDLDKSGTLTAGGRGAMHDYSYDLAPWDKDRNKIKKLIILDGITHVGQETFEYCSKLKTVTLPESVRSIGESAFYHCSSLTSINIPSAVTEIGDMAFDHCGKLTSVELPYGVEEIGESTFNCCTSLEEIVIPATVTEIGHYAFNACTSLKDVYFSGTAAQWDDIEIGVDNKYLLAATIHIASSGGSGGLIRGLDK